MSFTESVSTCFKKYFVFSGRASRSEFWWFYLFCIVLFPLGIFTFIPHLAVTVRRLHDTGRSGFFLLIPIFFAFFGMVLASIAILGNYSEGALYFSQVVPFIGTIILLRALAEVSDMDNRFGPDTDSVR